MGHLAAVALIVFALVRLIVVAVETLVFPFTVDLLPASLTELAIGSESLAVQVGQALRALVEFAVWLAVGLLVLRLSSRRATPARTAAERDP